ncbi:MAG TPA: thiamine phosphate synthase [Myxococcaceae bacterium]|nr:thiamine phosphate synthase [Myxococcaceae bacterium]
MGLPRLIVVTDWALPEDTHRAALEAVASLGPDVCIQHRDPGAPVRSFLERARWLAALTARTGAQLAVNGRLDVALLVGAHLHLPVGAPRPGDVRRWLPRERWISAAVHSEAELAEAAGCDAVLLSPVFAPGSKPGDPRPPLGPEGFARLARVASPLPCFALGGMTPDRLGTLDGCRGAAVQSGVLQAADPLAVARAFLARR